MIALRREDDGTLTFQLAETVLRGVPEEEFTESDVRTMSGEIHNIVLAMCMSTKFGWRPIDQFFVPLDGPATANALAEAAMCMLACSISVDNDDTLPDGLWVAVNALRTRGDALGLQFAPFFGSRLFSLAMVLKWLGGTGYLARYWRLTPSADQFTRDMCYFALVQFDQFMDMRISPMRRDRQTSQWETVSSHYTKAQSTLDPDDVHALIRDIVTPVTNNHAFEQDPDAPPQPQPPPPPAIALHEHRGDRTVRLTHEVLAMMCARERLNADALSRRTNAGAVEICIKFINAINTAVAMSSAMSADGYSRAESGGLSRKLSHVLISIPYLVNNDCIHLLLQHTQRFHRLSILYPHISQRSVAGMSFFAQFLTETQMDMYLSDLMDHVDAYGNKVTCTLIRQHIEPVSRSGRRASRRDMDEDAKSLRSMLSRDDDDDDDDDDDRSPFKRPRRGK